MRVLAGDVGGTKSLLAIFEQREHGDFQVVQERRFKSQSFRGLEEVLDAFGINGNHALDAACFAVAGPIHDGRCQTPNLPWQLDIRHLQKTLDLEPVALINDFLAVGHGLDLLTPDQILTLQDGKTDPHGPRAILGAGTGLGQAFAIWDGKRHRVYPSEGSHVDFAPRNALEIGLLKFLQGQFGRVSYDRVVNGSGLALIYRYLVDSGEFQASRQVRQEMAESDADPAAIVSKHALTGADPTCVRALHTFVSLYGAEAGNLALKLLATGGVYIAGGIAPKILKALRDGTFLEAFHDKGRFRSFMEALPLHIILEPRVGLLGAAAVAATPD